LYLKLFGVILEIIILFSRVVRRVALQKLSNDNISPYLQRTRQGVFNDDRSLEVYVVVLGALCFLLGDNSKLLPVVEVGGSALRHLFNYGFDLDRT
jgi:hypothetical protein